MTVFEFMVLSWLAAIYAEIAKDRFFGYSIAVVFGIGAALTAIEAAA